MVKAAYRHHIFRKREGVDHAVQRGRRSLVLPSGITVSGFKSLDERTIPLPPGEGRERGSERQLADFSADAAAATRP